MKKSPRLSHCQSERLNIKTIIADIGLGDITTPHTSGALTGRTLRSPSITSPLQRTVNLPTDVMEVEPMTDPLQLPDAPLLMMTRSRSMTRVSDSDTERCLSPPGQSDVLSVLESMSLSPASFTLSMDTGAVTPDQEADGISTLYSAKRGTPSSSTTSRGSLAIIEEVDVRDGQLGDVRGLRRGNNSFSTSM